jgi:enoyl-CoA hydratase
MNAIDSAMHRQLGAVWSVIDTDPTVRVSIVTGAGRAFSSGGDFADMADAESVDPVATFSTSFNEARALVGGIINSRKPIISAINGTAAGAGLAVALLADIPIAAKNARLFDGHTRIGVAAGDHAAMIWPLLCGMAKAKYFLMTNEVLTGEEAERHNLVALAVEAEELQERAVAVATRIARTAPSAISFTKHAINHWLRQAAPIFDLSLALELVGFTGGESREAISALTEKRVPVFASNGHKADS